MHADRCLQSDGMPDSRFQAVVNPGRFSLEVRVATSAIADAVGSASHGLSAGVRAVQHGAATTVGSALTAGSVAVDALCLRHRHDVDLEASGTVASTYALDLSVVGFFKKKFAGSSAPHRWRCASCPGRALITVKCSITCMTHPCMRGSVLSNSRTSRCACQGNKEHPQALQKHL